MLNIQEQKKLLNTGKWMIRFDNEGIAYNNFIWQPIGSWTIAPDWNTKPVCGNGLHGQGGGKGEHDYCQSGSRLVLCETKGKRIIINFDKIKVRKAKIIAINEDIISEFFLKISLDLRNYPHPLPVGLTLVGGYLDLRYYN